MNGDNEREEVDINNFISHFINEYEYVLSILQTYKIKNKDTKVLNLRQAAFYLIIKKLIFEIFNIDLEYLFHKKLSNLLSSMSSEKDSKVYYLLREIEKQFVIYFKNMDYTPTKTKEKYSIDELIKFLNSNIPGELYEKHVSSNNKKNRGLYYTPSFIVKNIVENTIGEVDILKDPLIKVLDPSCGSGNFLTQVYDILTMKFKNKLPFLRKNYSQTRYKYKGKYMPGKDYWVDDNIHYHILKNCIYGTDTDSFALLLTTIKLILKDVYNITTNLNIVKGDSLIKWDQIETGNQDWNGYDKENLINFWKNNFDYIIGNPPYVVLRESETDKNYWNYLMQNYNTIGYKKNLFYFMIERAIEKTKEGGNHSFVIPDRYLLARSYIKSRDNLFRKNNIISITKYDNQVFENAIVGVITYNACKNRYSKDNQIELRLNYKNKDNYERVVVPQENIIKTKDKSVNILTNSKTIGIISRIQEESVELRKFCFIHVGMMIRNKNDHFLNARNAPNRSNIVLGKDLDKYIIKNNNRYCDLNKIDIFGGTKNFNKHLSNPKILLRKTGGSIIASIDFQGYISEQSVYLIIPKNKKYVYNILGQIQSRLVNYYYKNYLITNPEIYPYIQHYDVQRLPINKKMLRERKFTEIIREVINLKYKLSGMGENEEKRKLKHVLKKKIEKADNMLYECYNLTEKQLDIIRDEGEGE